MGEVVANMPQGSSRNKIEYLAECMESMPTAGISEYASFECILPALDWTTENLYTPIRDGVLELTHFKGLVLNDSSVTSAENLLDDWVDSPMNPDIVALSMQGHINAVAQTNELGNIINVGGRLQLNLPVKIDPATLPERFVTDSHLYFANVTLSFPAYRTSIGFMRFRVQYDRDGQAIIISGTEAFNYTVDDINYSDMPIAVIIELYPPDFSGTYSERITLNAENTLNSWVRVMIDSVRAGTDAGLREVGELGGGEPDGGSEPPLA